MSWVHQRGKTFHLGFRFAGKLFRVSLKTMNERSAIAAAARVEENIRLFETGQLAIPSDCGDVATFLLSDGKLDKKPAVVETATLARLFDAFFEQLPSGAMEANSIYTARIHTKHLKTILGERTAARAITLESLQKYVERRSKQIGRRGRPISPTTIKKELTTIRGIWSWAPKVGHVDGPFPNNGLRFPKSADRRRFQTPERNRIPNPARWNGCRRASRFVRLPVSRPRRDSTDS